MAELTWVICLHKSKWSIIYGDRQETEIVCISHTFEKMKQCDCLALDIMFSVWLCERSIEMYLPCANPTDIHWAIRWAVSFTTVENQVCKTKCYLSAAASQAFQMNNVYQIQKEVNILENNIVLWNIVMSWNIFNISTYHIFVWVISFNRCKMFLNNKVQYFSVVKSKRTV